MAASASPPETPSAPRVPHPAQVCPGTLSLLCHRSPAQPGAGLTRHLGRGFLLGEGAGTTLGCEKTSGGSFRLSAHPDLHRPTPAAPVPLRPGSAVPARCPHGAGGSLGPPNPASGRSLGWDHPPPNHLLPIFGVQQPPGALPHVSPSLQLSPDPSAGFDASWVPRTPRPSSGPEGSGAALGTRTEPPLRARHVPSTQRALPARWGPRAAKSKPPRTEQHRGGGTAPGDVTAWRCHPAERPPLHPTPHRGDIEG